MKNTVLVALGALAAATALAGPVLAQPYGPPGYERGGGWDIGRRIDWIQDRIVHARDDGSLDRREFDRVQGELNGIRREDRDFRYNHGGHLDDRVRFDLEGRLERLNDQIHWIHEHHERHPW